MNAINSNPLEVCLFKVVSTPEECIEHKYEHISFVICIRNEPYNAHDVYFNCFVC